jgi:hypothetical protein
VRDQGEEPVTGIGHHYGDLVAKPTRKPRTPHFCPSHIRTAAEVAAAGNERNDEAVHQLSPSPGRTA